MRFRSVSKPVLAACMVAGLVSCHNPSNQELAMRRQNTTTGSRLPSPDGGDAALANDSMSAPGVGINTFQPRSK